MDTRINFKGKSFQKLSKKELKNIEGGIIPFVLGYVAGILLGAGGVCAGYHIAKAIK